MSKIEDGGPAFHPDMELRDWFAWNASDDEINVYRGAYDNPAGGYRTACLYNREQARYQFADAMLAARSQEPDQ